MCLGPGYKDDLDRVLSRTLFILLSQHFQLVLTYLLNGGQIFKIRGITIIILPKKFIKNV